MSAVTPVAGYPCHRPVQFSRWTNQHGMGFTDWVAACGATGYLTGAAAEFGRAGSARRKELCPSCFPGQRHDGHWPEPVEVPKEQRT